jgi:sortase (surface protein transpeptidase)
MPLRTARLILALCLAFLTPLALEWGQLGLASDAPPWDAPLVDSASFPVDSASFAREDSALPVTVGEDEPVANLPGVQAALQRIEGTAPSVMEDGSSSDADGESLVGQGSGIDVPSIPTRSARLDQLTADERVTPLRLEIDRIGLEVAIQPLGLRPNSTELEVPNSSRAVAWYRLGSAPGEPGSAVIAGHVDLWPATEGPFFRLSRLQPGDEVRVAMDDGSERRFQVVARQLFARDRLPLDVLFATDGEPRLTLITCGGTFDRTAREYSDNLVIQARPIA